MIRFANVLFERRSCVGTASSWSLTRGERTLLHGRRNLLSGQSGDDLCGSVAPRGPCLHSERTFRGLRINHCPYASRPDTSQSAFLLISSKSNRVLLNYRERFKDINIASEPYAYRSLPRDLIISVKTTASNHRTRVVEILDTWFRHASDHVSQGCERAS